MVRGPSATKRKHKTQAQDATTKRKYQAQAQMGATRPEAADKIAVYRVKSSFSSLF